MEIRNPYVERERERDCDGLDSVSGTKFKILKGSISLATQLASL